MSSSPTDHRHSLACGHAHGHGHGHGLAHGLPPERFDRAMAVGVGLNLAVIVFAATTAQVLGAPGGWVAAVGAAGIVPLAGGESI